MMGEVLNLDTGLLLHFGLFLESSKELVPRSVARGAPHNLSHFSHSTDGSPIARFIVP
ncbi:hypothetical protein J6590_061123 [Homalodisca vitripennis]|nr:hypothetical protein J6590_061123 [Homalodisca vitripennis]